MHPAQEMAMWSKLDSAYAQHWLTQGSEKETGGVCGDFEATLCNFSLGKCPAKPCYPDETVLSAEIWRALNSFRIYNYLDECCIGPGERSVNTFLAEERQETFYIYTVYSNF